MIRNHFMVQILSNLSEWNQQYVVRPQVTYLHIFSVWSGAVVKCSLWLGTPSGQFLLPTSCVALFRFFIGRTQKIVQNAITVPSPVHDVWEFVKSSSQKLLGNNSKMMGLVLLQSHFPLGLVTKECFLSLVQIDNDWHLTLIYYPTTWWRFSSALTKDQINVLFLVAIWTYRNRPDAKSHPPFLYPT